MLTGIHLSLCASRDIKKLEGKLSLNVRVSWVSASSLLAACFNLGHVDRLRIGHTKEILQLSLLSIRVSGSLRFLYQRVQLRTSLRRQETPRCRHWRFWNFPLASVKDTRRIKFKFEHETLLVKVTLGHKPSVSNPLWKRIFSMIERETRADRCFLQSGNLVLSATGLYRRRKSAVRTRERRLYRAISLQTF